MPVPQKTRPRLGRALLWAFPAAVGYAVLLPVIAAALDRRLGLVLLPGWTRWPAPLLLTAGLGLVSWTVWLFASAGDGTPNPLLPPQRLVDRGPYRFSRNPMMLGAWCAGLGLAFLLRSPSLLAMLAFVVGAGIAYVRRVEEPGLRRRFEETYLRYANETPRWLSLSRVFTGIRRALG